ncbi:MAG: Mycocerosic acid synthase [Verrucomicrobiae bacterium]|nr:Mycocerosic acid synthase [Verrucomicrobiae bacterium]
MSQKTTVACLREVGIPEQVVRIEEWELPALQPGQILVEPLISPINPADLNILTGTYGSKPTLPVVLGNEGVGVVTAGSLPAGQRVLAPMQLGWWCTARILNAAEVFPIPAEIPAEVAAMLAVNPPTAYRMLMDFVELKPGDWLIQNAANSGVGRCVIAIAKAKGFHTINVVRRKELIPELEALGADLVLTDETPVAKQITGKEIKLALNAVGGESARQIAKTLAPHGTHVTYGAMGREPLRLDNGLLIFRDIRFRGFWVSDWYRHATRADIIAMFTELRPLIHAGKFNVPIEQTYPLVKIREALAHAARAERTGKILLSMKAAAPA